MIYYNGFNLLVDVLLGLAVWFFTYRTAWWDGYEAGVVDEITAQDMYDNKGESKDMQYESSGWHIDPWGNSKTALTKAEWQAKWDNKCNHVYESHCPKCGIEGENNG